MHSEGILVKNTGGIVNKAAEAGSADSEKYMRHWQRHFRKDGGYQLQMSPHDIASLVNHSKPYMRNHRMLCIGVETFGAERFIAEELGMLEVDIINGNDVPDNGVILRKGGVKLESTLNPSGTYDLITLFGDGEFNLDAILQYSHVNTLVACLNTNIAAGMPDLRRCWFELRNKHFAILQTTEKMDMGVGIVRITHKEENHVVSKKPFYTKRPDSSICESGNQSQTKQPSESKAGQGDKNSSIRHEDDPGRSEEETGRESLDSPSVQEGRSEDFQWTEEEKQIFLAKQKGAMKMPINGTPELPSLEESVKVFDISMIEGKSILHADFKEKQDAPYGRKKDGNPMKRRGRQAVV